MGNRTASVQKAIIATLHNAKQPLSRRAISNITGIEICALCQPLLKLRTESGKPIYIAYMEVCQETGEKVQHFGLTARRAGK